MSEIAALSKDGFPTGTFLPSCTLALILGDSSSSCSWALADWCLESLVVLVSPLDGIIENFNLVLLERRSHAFLQIRTKASPAVLGHQVECGICFQSASDITSLIKVYMLCFI
jgi:hypothetical protein